MVTPYNETAWWCGYMLCWLLIALPSIYRFFEPCTQRNVRSCECFFNTGKTSNCICYYIPHANFCWISISEYECVWVWGRQGGSLGTPYKGYFPCIKKKPFVGRNASGSRTSAETSMFACGSSWRHVALCRAHIHTQTHTQTYGFANKSCETMCTIYPITTYATGDRLSRREH